MQSDTFKLDLLISDLNNLCYNPSLDETKEQISKLIQSVKGLSVLTDLKINNYFTLPQAHLQKFINNNSQNLVVNPKSTIPILKGILFTLETYIETIQVMTKGHVKKEAQEEVKRSVPLISASVCTLDKYNRGDVLQKAYHCETCGILGDGMVCEGCANECHKGHKLNLRGFLTGFCDCRFLTRECNLMQTCTFKQTENNYMNQPNYACITCNMRPLQGDMICKFCAEKCHANHDVQYLGIINAFCDCASKFDFCVNNKQKEGAEGSNPDASTVPK